jgi:DNA-binding response OmpR family regulator
MRETILLVDDADSLREMLRETLAELGYRVLVAASGEEGLGIAQERKEPIHVLLTDVLMPGVAGPELASRLVASHRETRVLFMTGSGPEAMSLPGVIAGGGAVLEKPFSGASLETALRKILDR